MKKNASKINPATEEEIIEKNHTYEEKSSTKEVGETKKSVISEFLSLNSIIFCGLIACLPIIGGILVTKYYKIQTKDFEIIQYKEEQGIELTPDEKEFQERYKKYNLNKKEAEKKQGGIFRPRIKKK